jgi:glycerate kinase
MKIAIAFDSFKGSLSSVEAAHAFIDGFRSEIPDTDFVSFAIADGGEGMLSSLSTPQSVTIEKDVTNPIGTIVLSKYLIEGHKAIIEMAQASGLTLVPEHLRNPMLTTSFGTGELIMDALEHGCQEILLGIGGSATNDAGMGILSALGYRFLDADGNELQPCGANLSAVQTIDDTKVQDIVKEAKYTIACDVDAPFCGPNGAAYTFAAQKGADKDMINILDKGMHHFADIILKHYGINIKDIPGAGAAGGVGGSLKAVLNANLKKGIDIILNTINFEKQIEDCNLVITGEGHIDHQTMMSKAPSGVLRIAQKKGIPVIALGGRVTMCEELKNSGFRDILCITPHSMPIHQAIHPQTATSNLRNTAIHIARMLK